MAFFLALLAGLAGTLADRAVNAQSKTTIIEYDKDGRPVGATARERQTPAGTNARVPPRAPERSRNQPRSVDGELIVTNVSPDFEASVATLGFSVLERINLRSLDMVVYRLRVPPRTSVDDAKSALGQRYPGIVSDANSLYDPSAADDSLRSGSLARAQAGWDQTSMSCGFGLKLGLIDGFVDEKHPALSGQRVRFRNFQRENLPRPGAASHGTAVAALLVGSPAGIGFGGIFPGAELVAGNMLEQDGGQDSGNAVGLMKALDWMAEEKVHVVNMSIARPDNTVVRLSVEKARRSGLVMVAAAGNWGAADRPAYPGAYPAVIAVTAIDDRRLVYQDANRGEYIAFSAPGVKVWTAIPGGGKYQSGTSFASPFVAALLAQEVARGMEREANAIKARFGATAIDLGKPGKDDVFGYGLINAKSRCWSGLLYQAFGIGETKPQVAHLLVIVDLRQATAFSLLHSRQIGGGVGVGQERERRRGRTRGKPP
ncbi:MAG: hypothetical protein EXQ85_07210 [Alphaproteobacteria bacterium]|nr:hypothetical protein [Alphaproteobacteria bacterium]